MDCQVQVSCSRLWEFVVCYSNVVILKTKTFSEFFIPLMKSPSTFEHFQKEEDCHSYCISEISYRPMLGRATHYSAPSQNIPQQSTCSTVPNTIKSSCEHFYNIFPALWGEMIWKISPWWKCEIIGLFVNIWTAAYKYSVPVCQNLLALIEIQLS